MLHGNLASLSTVSFINAKLEVIINAAKAILAQNPPAGRYPIEGEEDAFMLVVEAATEPREQRKAEFHRTYADIQILLEGEETIDYGLTPPKDLIEDELEAKDYALSKTIDNEQAITLAPFDFAIFYPGEPHRPLVAITQPQAIKKAIIKVKADLLSGTSPA
ncbi:N-acetylneuraminate anomerase [Polycladidibacter hongkongensis]|uniref:N-acetylneuraminate anomerase n=1 Tax=Polycladidibacter hongkongensis TaxID=1647556 RepID=UPI00083172D6|nr:N-acetylneuraminate anomerase [Pseudovibrio hongkongensis]